MSWCARCSRVDDRRLYGRLSAKTALCSGCWQRQGRPFPLPDNLTPEELHEHEEQIRRRMLERGGTDRHLVSKGAA